MIYHSPIYELDHLSYHPFDKELALKLQYKPPYSAFCARGVKEFFGKNPEYIQFKVSHIYAPHARHLLGIANEQWFLKNIIYNMWKFEILAWQGEWLSSCIEKTTTNHFKVGCLTIDLLEIRL